MLARIINGGILLTVILTVGACSTDNLAPVVEQPDDPEGSECIARGYEFASELFRSCRNELIEEHAKQRKSGGLY